MIKIGYIISHLENTGPVNILYGIIKYLDKNKFEPYIITLKPEKINTREKEFEDLGVKIIKNITSNVKIFLKKDYILLNKIKELKLDILHTHCVPSTILVAKLPLEIKKMTTIHCDFSTDLVFKFGKIKGNIYKHLYIRALRKMNLNINCGKSVGKANKKHSNIDGIYILNGIDTEYMSKKKISATKQEIREKLKIENDKKVFIVVGSIDMRKNVIFIAKIFKEKFREHYLFILGGGDKERELQGIIKNCKNIIYFGRKKLVEIQSYLKASDYYISASLSEGVPNSVLEAVNFDLPVVLSNIGAHKEILELDNKLGVLFINNNENDFINAVLKILTQKSSENLSDLKYMISAKRMSEEYMGCYEMLNSKEGKKTI